MRERISMHWPALAGFLNRTEEREKQSFFLELARTQRDIKAAYTNFNHVTERDLIDFYIYNLKAAQAEYVYLLTYARKKGYILSVGKLKNELPRK